MKKIIGLFTVLSVFYQAQTQQVTHEFSRILLDEDFTNLAGKWSQESTADNLFVGDPKGYKVWRKNSKSGFFILSEKEKTYTVFECFLHFSFESKGSKSQSAGIVLQAQADGTGAIVVELNKKKQYRIRRAVNNRFISLTGEGEGWVKAKKAVTAGENMITIRTYDKIYDLYINGNFIRSFTEIEFSGGKMALFIGAGSKAVFHRLTVRTDDDHANTENRTNVPIDEEKTLSGIIVKLKETINKKDKKIAELEAELRLANARGGKDTSLARLKLEAENRALQFAREIENLKNERYSLLQKIETLEAFKKSIKESENGDIIINLTNLSATQKGQIEQLTNTIRTQTLLIDQLKKEKADMELEMKNRESKAQGNTNEKLNLLQRLVEKDSIITAMEEKIKLLETSLDQCSKNTNKGKSTGSKRHKDKRKSSGDLFDE